MDAEEQKGIVPSWLSEEGEVVERRAEKGRVCKTGVGAEPPIQCRYGREWARRGEGGGWEADTPAGGEVRAGRSVVVRPTLLLLWSGRRVEVMG